MLNVQVGFKKNSGKKGKDTGLVQNLDEQDNKTGKWFQEYLTSSFICPPFYLIKK